MALEPRGRQRNRENLPKFEALLETLPKVEALSDEDKSLLSELIEGKIQEIRMSMNRRY